MKAAKNLFDIIHFDAQGLIPAIAQDYQTGEILMMAWMNKASLELTLKQQIAHYFSRSRQKLWKKGEESGHIQEVQELLIDCDGDCLVLKVKQHQVACHTGKRSCFFRKINQQAQVENYE
jgi:phosphoribosyl-AMP cyclohydrolase